MSESERLSSEELQTLFLFENLEEDKLAWVADRGEVVAYAPGATIHAEGRPASCFFVLLEGEMAMYSRVEGGEIELFRTGHRGSYTGAFNAFVAQHDVPQVYYTTARAVTDCRFYELPAPDFGRAVREWFPMAAHLLEGATTRGRAASDTVARHERLVALGSVTASLTHELNNPVTAVLRATARLRERLVGMRAQVGRVIMSELTPDQLQAIADMAADALERRREAPSLSAIEAADREDELAEWLEDRGVSDSWETAPTLVGAGIDLQWVERLAAAVPAQAFETSLAYPVHAVESDGLLDEISEAAERVSALLVAAKQYTQMDRGPLQSFDIHEGLDATLTMLGHKLEGFEVIRDYDRSLRQIGAYPGELNQVWTNLIDNAVDAMGSGGKLTVRTRPLGDDRLLVEICDTGPGVPDEARNRVFEPFFTTKPVGKGTGLGLDIAWRIVVGRHRGDLRVESVPGDTRFQVTLPLR